MAMRWSRWVVTRPPPAMRPPRTDSQSAPSAQATPLATIQRLDPMYIELTQSSTELLKLRQEIDAGSAQSTTSVPVEIVLEDGTVYPHAGRLSFAEAMRQWLLSALGARIVKVPPV